MTLRTRFGLYVLLLQVPFAGLAAWVLRNDRLWMLAVELGFILSLVYGLRLGRLLFGTLDVVGTGRELLSERDFGTRFREVGHPEVDQLVRIYNDMADRLREERIRQEEQQYFLGKVLDSSPSGVVTLDHDGRVAQQNPAARSLLGETIGRPLVDVDGPLAPALAALETGESRVVPLSGGRRIRCQRGEFLDRGFPRTFFLLEELTEELRRSEKSAYEKLIRMMAHEVNNSIGATSSLLQSCLLYGEQLKIEDREDFGSALKVVLARASELSRFMRDLAEVVRIPAPRKEPVDPGELLSRVEALFRAELQSRRITWRWAERASGFLVEMDRAQMEQVLVNVVKNALEAIGEDGVITARFRVEGRRGWLVVEDSGPGLSKDARTQVFTPFFTTKENGQGIGLTMVKEILGNHRFDFSLESPPGGPTRFTIAV